MNRRTPGARSIRSGRTVRFLALALLSAAVFFGPSAKADDNTVDTFNAAEFTEDWTPEEGGMARPSATWTYMVHDNPFGTELERFLVNGAKLMFGKKR